MKTLTKTSALIFALAILFSTTLSASAFNFSEESYINDIPFDTVEVYNNIITEQNLNEFNFEEDNYIDDIPFDTKCISIDCLYNKALLVEFNFEEEDYINDLTL